MRSFQFSRLPNQPESGHHPSWTNYTVRSHMNKFRTLCSLFLLPAFISFQSAHATDPSASDPFANPSPTTTPSQDHTIKLLRSTVIKLVDWPKQPLAERLALIKQEASKVGLSVKISEKLGRANLIYPPLRIRNISLNDAIKYTTDCTKLCVRITDNGVIYFYIYDEKDPGSKGHP